MKSVLGVVAIGVLLVLSPGAAGAQPPTPPVMYQGSVTIDGQDAPVGTIVTAGIDGVEVATNAPDGTAQAGQYYLPISNDGYEGKTVVFKVGGVVAGEHEFVDRAENPVVLVDLSAEGVGEGPEAGEQEETPGTGEAAEGEDGAPANGDHEEAAAEGPADEAEESPATPTTADRDKWLGFLPAAWGTWPWPMAGLIGGAVAVIVGIILLIRALRHRYD